MIESECPYKPIVKAEITTMPTFLTSSIKLLVADIGDRYEVTNLGEYIADEWIKNVRSQFSNEQQAIEYFKDLRNGLKQIKYNYNYIDHKVELNYGNKSKRLTNESALIIGMIAEAAAIKMIEGPQNADSTIYINKSTWGDISELNEQLSKVHYIDIRRINIAEIPKQIPEIKKYKRRIESHKVGINFSKLELRFSLLAGASWAAAFALALTMNFSQPEVKPVIASNAVTVSYLTSKPWTLPNTPQLELNKPLEIDKRIPTNINTSFKSEPTQIKDVAIKTPIEMIEDKPDEVAIVNTTIVEALESNTQPQVQAPITLNAPIIEEIPEQPIKFEIQSSGIPVAFNQKDTLWQDATLGFTNKKFKDAGCFITALASAISKNYYVTPSDLNEMLKNNDGFDQGGNIYWGKVRNIFKERVSLAKVNDVNLNKLVNDINSGNVPLVKLNSHSHWLAVHGIEESGGKYFLHVSDPWGGFYTQYDFSLINQTSYRLVSFNK